MMVRNEYFRYCRSNSLKSLKTRKIGIAEIPVPHVRSGICLSQGIRSSDHSASSGRCCRLLGPTSSTKRCGSGEGKAGAQDRDIGPKIRPCIKVRQGVEGFVQGDRVVVSNGIHSEVVCVPMHFCAQR